MTSHTTPQLSPLQNGHFLSVVPKVSVVERFDCNSYFVLSGMDTGDTSEIQRSEQNVPAVTSGELNQHHSVAEQKIHAEKKIGEVRGRTKY